MINLNNPNEIRIAGIQALENALGHIGMVKFMQQFEQGYGDYSKEKYSFPEITLEEIDEFLAMDKNRTNN